MLPLTSRISLYSLVILVAGFVAGCDGDGPKAPADSGAPTADGGSQCSMFEDDQALTINVTITNNTSAAIYLGQQEGTCGATSLFHVDNAAGRTLRQLPFCRNPCEAAMRGQPYGCPALCQLANTITLQPGESTKPTWDGLYSVNSALAQACSPSGQSVVCDRAEQIQPGTFTFVAQAGTELNCAGALDCNQCTVISAGGCSTPGALTSGMTLTAQQTVDLDATYGVGGTGTKTVKIVFTN
ncbi:MAG TPA: hypothetical protein VL137_00435 [Polyangiaceae bacterium]|nr:hypothetical protein [Polyangiaceae bacterium]